MSAVHFLNLGEDPMADMIRRHEAPIAEAVTLIQAMAIPDAIVIVTEYSHGVCVVGATTRAKFFASPAFRAFGTEAAREELRAWPQTKGRILLVATRLEPRGCGYSELEIQDIGGRDGN